MTTLASTRSSFVVAPAFPSFHPHPPLRSIHFHSIHRWQQFPSIYPPSQSLTRVPIHSHTFISWPVRTVRTWVTDWLHADRCFEGWIGKTRPTINGVYSVSGRHESWCWYWIRSHHRVVATTTELELQLMMIRISEFHMFPLIVCSPCLIPLLVNLTTVWWSVINSGCSQVPTKDLGTRRVRIINALGIVSWGDLNLISTGRVLINN